MNLFLELVPAGIMQGLILALVAIGITIPFRLLDFPDLTAEGSYPLGGSICASLLTLGCDPFTATGIAAVGAGLLGMGTAMLHLRFRINTLLAGIILSTMMYSINLRLMGKPNLALFNYPQIFSSFGENTILTIIVLFILNSSILALLYKFLLTEKGLRLRAVGLNPRLAEQQSIQRSSYVLLGLFLGNLLVGLASSIMVQTQGYMDVGMGVGIVIHALAALMIGESIIGQRILLHQIFAPFLGALIYQQIQGLAISFGFAPSDLKLVTGGIVLLALAYKARPLRTV